MSSITERIAVRGPIGGRVNLGWAFVERQTNLWKRYWAWELVWLVYGVVNTLAITFIAGGRIVAEGTPLELRERIAQGRPLEEINMETVFMELTGKRLEEDEERVEEMASV